MANIEQPASDDESQTLVLEPHRFGSSAIVRVRGELDAYGAPRLETLGSDLLAEGVGELIIDLGETTFLDSSGLRAILTLHRRVSNDGDGEFAIGNPSESVVRLLEITGLSDYFVVRRDLEHSDNADGELQDPGPASFSD